MKKPIIILIAIVLLIILGLAGAWMLWENWSNSSSLSDHRAQKPSPNVIHSPWLLPRGTVVLKNRGKACFFPYQHQLAALPTNDLQVQVYSSGCYSSSCTTVYERTGSMQIDQVAFKIYITSRFAVKSLGQLPKGQVRICTDDCGGAGYLQYHTGTLQDGIYQVYIGDILVGALTIPQTNLTFCLDTDHPVEPQKTYPSSQTTDIPYPMPLEIAPSQTIEPYPAPTQ